jgi:hypothetical protein
MPQSDRYFVVFNKNGKAEAITVTGMQEPEGAVIKDCDSLEEAKRRADQENSLSFREERVARANHIRRGPPK